MGLIVNLRGEIINPSRIQQTWPPFHRHAIFETQLREMFRDNLMAAKWMLAISPGPSLYMPWSYRKNELSRM